MNKTEILKQLQQYGRIMDRLRDAGILRSGNNPVADYTEWLVARKLGLELTPNSNKSFDAIHPRTKIRYQIKARRITESGKPRQMSVIRSTDFDYLIAVIFDRDFKVLKALKIPKKLIRTPFVRFSKHQNGHILILRGPILEQRDIEEIKL
ncbi:MAG: hypothetical protein IT406_00695 [Candidatus Yanofskybacteria bacterium]|nr:hypothetical protein [Candidatus Yanofskybacteria bacterium]